jgi:dolichol-phosphate mannosyltransferase
MKTLVIFPTYNEKENIAAIVAAVLSKLPELHILVVDDGSPDGTGNIVKDMMGKNNKIHLIENQGKGGLGKAYLQGFRWALDHGFDACVQMDADFSHRPIDLVELVKALKNNDFVIGSRYVEGGATTNWAWYRKLISLFGSFYSRIILGYPVNDWTGGFNGWNRRVLEKLKLDEVRSEGYSFQIEMKYRGLKNNFKVKEVPITFDERREGASKMSLRIVIEAFYRVWQIRFLV